MPIMGGDPGGGGGLTPVVKDVTDRNQEENSPLVRNALSSQNTLWQNLTLPAQGDFIFLAREHDHIAREHDSCRAEVGFT